MRGYLLVLAAAVLWSLIGPVAKWAFAAGMDPMTLAFFRVGLGWLLFGGEALLRGQTRLERRDIPAIAAFGVICVAGLFASMALAVEAGGASLAVVLLYTAPAWVALLSRIFLGEPMTPAKLAAVSLTILGVTAVSLGQGEGGGIHVTPLAVVYGLTAGITYALYYLFGKLYLHRYATATVFLYAMPVALLVLAPFATFRAYPPAGWAATAILAGVCTYGAYSVYYAGLRHLEATRAAIVATIEPVCAAILAYFWWDERFGLWGYVGSACILGGVLLTMLPAERLRQAMVRLFPVARRTS